MLALLRAGYVNLADDVAGPLATSVQTASAGSAPSTAARQGAGHRRRGGPVGASALVLAAAGGHLQCVESLLGLGAGRDSAARVETEVAARVRGVVDPAAFENEALVAAAKGGHCAVVNVLLRHGSIDLSIRGGHALAAALQRGHFAVAEQLLDADAGSRDMDCYDVIITAAEAGAAGVVRRLLARPAVNPAVRDQAALRGAAKGNHVAVVALLLADPRVNPAANGYAPLRAAVEHGAVDAVAALLDSPRVKTRECGEPLLLHSVLKNGRFSMARLLLTHPQSTEGENARSMHQALHHAVAVTGDAKVVKYLLANPRWRPDAGMQPLICTTAAQRSDASLLQLLLAVPGPGFDPSLEGDDALRAAIRSGKPDNVALLLQDERVGWQLRRDPEELYVALATPPTVPRLQRWRVLRPQGGFELMDAMEVREEEARMLPGWREAVAPALRVPRLLHGLLAYHAGDPVERPLPVPRLHAALMSAVAWRRRRYAVIARHRAVHGEPSNLELS